MIQLTPHPYGELPEDFYNLQNCDGFKNPFVVYENKKLKDDINIQNIDAEHLLSIFNVEIGFEKSITTSQLSKVDGVLNGVKIQTDHLNSLFLEGQGAGGKATASSIISDLFEIINKSQNYSFGYKIEQLKNKQALDYNDRISSYYLRIKVKI